MHYGASERNSDVEDLDRELWERRDGSSIDPLFPAYRAWFERRIRPQLEAGSEHRAFSHVPCDFSAIVRAWDSFPLLLVGLNSTWQQYDGGEFEGRLTVPAQQLQAALGGGEAGGSPLENLQRTPRALLLQHHPPSWLSQEGHQTYEESVYPPGRFDLCLHGHLHHGRSQWTSISGSVPRCFFQSPSLLGLEQYGTKQQRAAFGFTWGSLTEDGTVRIWPFRRVRRGSGAWVFDHDQEFAGDPDGVVIAGSTRAPTALKVDLGPYLGELVKRTDHFQISGIVTAAKGALRPRIENLYTPLSTRGGWSPAEGKASQGRPDAERVALTELLPHHRRLLLEGQPGAGKTTFLKLVACMLARDLLGDPCPGGGPWRRHYLGLDANAPCPLPVLLRVGDLGELLAAPGAPPLRGDNRLWLLDLLEHSCRANEHAVPREEWLRRLEGGEALLLLDGLDEVDDAALRERVFSIFRDAADEWPGPIVVTSRPFSTETLRAMGFRVATVEPLGDDEVHTFLDQWLAALHGGGDGALGGEARRERGALAEAIFTRPAVRRLAANPVMLTCLCVVHWNEGQIPEGRALVYQAVIRWLIQARSELRKRHGFTDLFARDAFACLAFHMMSTARGKVSALEVGEAAEAVEPLLARDPSLASKRAGLDRAREWLSFESMGGSIVEELPGRRMRFWHLTFQEYLAAVYLDGLEDGESGESGWWSWVLAKRDDAQWRETIDLLPGIFLHRGSKAVDLLLSRVLATRGKRPSLAEEARVVGLLGRLLAPLVVLEYRPPRELQEAYEQSLHRTLSIFTPEGARQVPFADRLAAAEALGQAGDPRLAQGANNFLDVPGQGGLKLGMYPVTVEEYRLFVEAPGYEEPRFWSPDGWRVRQSGDWAEPVGWIEQLQHPNHPVMLVSWHEAQAYCRWLSEQRGERVRLPSAEEWERAASRPAGDYPWGEAMPSVERANFDGKVDDPTPVGLYPTGEGPFGHLDLAGNVWEWCEDEISLLEVKGVWEKRGVGRVLKGGGWGGPAKDLRSAIRGRNLAWDRDRHIGFRLAVSPPSR